MSGTVIVAGASTPIGKLSGALGGFAATELGGFAIAGALERAGVKPEQVDYVFMGQVILAGAGQITARQAAANAGIPMTVPSTTINKVCLSGLNAIYLADLLINAGEADIVVAGGMESMTQAPYLLPGARAGYRIGDQTVVDSMMFDGLFCAFDDCAMGLGHRALQRGRRSLPRASGRLQRPLPRAGRRGHQGRQVRRRDHPGRACPSARAIPWWSTPTRASDPRPPPSPWASSAPPSTRAAPSRPATPSQISDGGAAVIVMSKAKAEELGRHPSRRAGQLRAGGRAESLAAPPAVPRHLGGARQGRAEGQRHRPLRDQRGVRRRGVRLGRRSRHQRRCRQRQRGRHRPRSPGRDVRAPVWRSPPCTSSSGAEVVPRR